MNAEPWNMDWSGALGLGVRAITASDSRMPASIRTNNPGAQWPGPSASRFGSSGYERLHDAQGNRIARFDTPEQGAAAQFDLLSRKYSGMTVGDAIRKWSGGNSSDSYAASVASSMGMRPTDVLSPQILSDPGRAIPFAKAMARVEAGRDYPMSDDQWTRAYDMYAGGAQPMAYSGEQSRAAGVRAIDGAMGGGRGHAPAPPAQMPWQMDWSGHDIAPSQGAQQAAPGNQLPWEMEWREHELAQQAAAPSGVWNNLTAGANDMIYSTLGAPVDAATWLTNKAVQGINAATGAEIPQARTDLPGSSRWLAGTGETVGVHDPRTVQATSTEEKLARAAGAGAAGMLAPEAVLGGLNRAGVVGEGAMSTLGQVFGRSATVGDAAINAGVGAAAGVGGQMSGNLAPEPWKPLVETAGSLLGGAAGAGVIATGRGAAEAVRTGKDWLAPLTEAGQERAAGSILLDAARDPGAFRDALATAPRDIVPGSRPTTFQMTGDMGIGGLERVAATKNPEAFMQRRADQNSARVEALEGIQPQGAPEAVVQALRQNLEALDISTGRAVDDAMRAAQTATSKLGGAGTPEGYGTKIRQSVADARATAKAREDELWAAVDPDSSLNLSATGTRQAARGIVRGLEKSAKPLAGEERGSIVTAMRYPDVIPFREMVALRSRVSEALREELSRNGWTRVYGRLSQLRAAIEADIEGAVAAKAAMEQRAVQAGAMSEEDSLEARLRNWTNVWTDARRDSAQSAGGVASGGASFGSTADGAGFSRGGGSSGASRDQGLQGPDLFPSGLEPNFDEAAAGRLKDASAATKQRAETFDRGPAGEALRGATSDTYTLPSAVVPARFFRPGPRGFEAMQALKNAAPEAMNQVRGYAIATLRKAAERADGTLDPVAVQRWRENHADALRAVPEVDRMLADPVRASESFARMADLRKAEIDAFQQGTVARLLNLEDPADVKRTIGGIFSRQDQVQQMARLARETAGNPEAREGLRKAIADYITLRFISNTEGATSSTDLMRSDAFQQFLKQSAPALQTVMSDAELNLMKAIAADLKRSNRSVSAVKLPGQSNTAQDMTAVSRNSHPQSVLSRVLASGGAATVGAVTGGPLASIAAVMGAEAIHALRNAGLKNVDDLVKDALLNPERAKALLARAPAKPSRRDGFNFSQRYARSALLPGPDEQEH